jgi:hypothetical protein
MAISRAQMEEQIKGFAPGGIANVDPFEDYATGTDLKPLDMTQFEEESQPTTGATIDSIQKDLERLRSSRAIPVDSALPKTPVLQSDNFKKNFTLYKDQLMELMNDPQKPSFYQLASDVGAAMLAADPKLGAFRSLGLGFASFSEKENQRKAQRQQAKEAVRLKAFELARGEAEQQRKNELELRIANAEAANKPYKAITFEFDIVDPTTGEITRKSLPFNANNPVEIEYARKLPNVRQIETPQSAVNISSATDPYLKFAAERMNEVVKKISGADEDAQAIKNDLGALENALEAINYDVGAIKAGTLDVRKVLSELGVRPDAGIPSEEIVRTIQTRLALRLVALTKGPISDREMTTFINAMPGLGSSPEGIRQQIALMKEVAEYNEKFFNDYNSNAELRAILDAPSTEFNAAQKETAYNNWRRDWFKNNKKPYELAYIRNLEQKAQAEEFANDRQGESASILQKYRERLTGESEAVTYTEDDFD